MIVVVAIVGVVAMTMMVVRGNDDDDRSLIIDRVIGRKDLIRRAVWTHNSKIIIP